MPTGPPQLIITDQDPAMAKSIAKVLPGTFHRYCIWHIMNKFQEKLGPINYHHYSHLFRASIYESNTEEEFELAWSNALQQSELHSHVWLRSIYDIRQRWVPAYVNQFFSAGCSSSQRAESGHSFFKKYVAKGHSLVDFVTRFFLALEYQRDQELHKDFLNINEKPKINSRFPMEKQMATIYTKKIFTTFQKELSESEAYLHTPTTDANVYVVVRVGEDSSKPHRLFYDASTDFLRCSCRFFEFEGIPCRHMLHFFRLSQVVLLPEKYILKRWTRNAKERSICDNVRVDVSDVSDVSIKSLMERRALVSQFFFTVLDDAILSENGTKMMLKHLEELADGIKQLNLTEGHEEAPTTINISEEVIMSDPRQVRSKGCGSGRFKSGKEKAIKKGRLCHGCGLRNQAHDRRNCPKLINLRDNVNVETSDSSDQEETRINESD